MNIYLPVSLGEAIDKYSILILKSENLTGLRQVEVNLEISILEKELDKYLIKFNDLYLKLKHVNYIIWKQMDALRDDDSISNKTFGFLAYQCTLSNDVRFRIKNKINLLSQSLIKEQKAYFVKTLKLIFTDFADTNVFRELIYELSFIYDAILIELKDPSAYLEYFKDDPTVLINQKSEKGYKIIRTEKITKDINPEILVKNLKIPDIYFDLLKITK